LKVLRDVEGEKAGMTVAKKKKKTYMAPANGEVLA
jgi:hypothetical protein